MSKKQCVITCLTEILDARPLSYQSLTNGFTLSDKTFFYFPIPFPRIREVSPRKVSMMYYRSRYEKLIIQIRDTPASSRKHHKANRHLTKFQLRMRTLQEMSQCGFDDTQEKQGRLRHELLEKMLEIYQPWLKAY
ncbi:MAG: hypothetical protein ACLFUB_16210 [Cyclobacteriaceae bacterium]